MISAEEKASKEEETFFDTFEIDNQIFKKGEYIQTEKGKPDKLKNKFKHLKGLTKELLDKKDPNSDFPKYFAQIKTKQFKYTGFLSNQLKRDLYGYSFMENDDEYLGEYKNEIREGFGIYKFRPNEEEKDIYIGDYKNNKKTGNGIYLKVFKVVENDSPAETILINFNCGIGEFQDDIFKKGKIFSVQNDIETLYQGKINELGLPSDEEALVYSDGDKLFFGKMVDGEMIEGRNIFVDENWEKKKAYYFTKSNNNRDAPYNFDLNKNQEKDDENIKKMKESFSKKYKDIIQNIFKDINSAFDRFKNYDTAIAFNFENEIKKQLKNIVDNIIKD